MGSRRYDLEKNDKEVFIGRSLGTCFAALFEKVEGRQLEGGVAKRKDSLYSGLQSRDWLKVRTNSGKLTIQKRIETWG
jgi:ATP-dependent DNA ligase